jgi:beta-glucosidase
VTQFPDDFLWGAATSAFQIEGSPLADGAGPSIWYRFAHTPGRMERGETGDLACDHYRRFAEDIELMKQIGLQAYRFSVAWSRILPQGTGRVNRAGLDFYERLVDRLLDAEITPLLTLFHWDLPAALDDRGGWLNPEIADWFAEYARVVAHALGDRVPLWATMNEPWVVVDAGYLHGVHAPGHRNLYEAPLVSRNLLRAHAAAVRAFRAESPAQIGLILNLEPKEPATSGEEDRLACARADASMNRQYLEPVLLGQWPKEMRDIYGEAWPADMDACLPEIREPIDYLGVNYYKRGVTRHDPAAPPVFASEVFQESSTYTEMNWEVHAESLKRLLLWVRERSGDLPIFVTENGAAFYDPPQTAKSVLPDPLRIDYLRDHLRAVHAAREAGANVRGYFVWSLLDNVEWSVGTTKRFGLVHVDFATQRRTLKSSALFYQDVIRTCGASLDL